MDRIFKLLSDKDRRRLLVALLDDGSHAAEPIAIPEDIEPRDEEERYLRVGMVHNHLPLLEEAGVVTWDRDTCEVIAGPRFEELQPIIELLDKHASEMPGEWV